MKVERFIDYCVTLDGRELVLVGRGLCRQLKKGGETVAAAELNRRLPAEKLNLLQRHVDLVVGARGGPWPDFPWTGAEAHCLPACPCRYCAPSRLITV